MFFMRVNLDCETMHENSTFCCTKPNRMFGGSLHLLEPKPSSQYYAWAYVVHLHNTIAVKVHLPGSRRLIRPATPTNKHSIVSGAVGVLMAGQHGVAYFHALLHKSGSGESVFPVWQLPGECNPVAGYSGGIVRVWVIVALPAADQQGKYKQAVKQIFHF
ncbi:hypothetical protein EKK58_09700 [Candidatus Dependentiae bacterium]|nr:MAG: hypothetical protein EKK58_09700 [Candidatus Dependentiae bacterium]